MTANSTQIVKGSIAQIAKETGTSIAEAWFNVNAIILVDISASMDDLARAGKTRWEVAQEELKNLQNSLPGKLAVIAFSEDATFCPTGAIPPTQSTTEMGKALRFAHIADSIKGMRFIVISDGEPTDESDALDAAGKFKNKIDTIYVGPETGSGRDFLKKLAAKSGGTFMLKPELQYLADGVHGLLGL